MNPAIKLLFLFLGLVLILSGMVLYPIFYYEVDFPFILNNALFIFVFVLFAWQILYFDTSPISKHQMSKMVLIPACIFIAVFLIRKLNHFMVYMEETALLDLMPHLAYSDQQLMQKFIQTEYLFFGVGAILTVVLLPFRLLNSIWKQYNNR